MLDRGGKAGIKTGVHRKTHHDSYDRKSGKGATMDVVQAGRQAQALLTRHGGSGI